MRKIVVTFSKVNKLKKAMKETYKNAANNGVKLAMFNLGKRLIPSKVEEVEMEITKLLASNVKVTIPKTSLTFLSTEEPFNVIDSNCEIEGNYLVLPWNITTNLGKEQLKTLINKITTSTKSIKYTVSVNTQANEGAAGLDVISNAELSLSENSFEDQTDGLFNRCEELENQIRLVTRNLESRNTEITTQQNVVVEKNNEINRLNNQITNLNTQAINLNTELGNLRNTNYSLSSQITQLNSRILQLSSNQVEWDQRVPNQTTLDFVGFTGKVIAKINPINGTFAVNIY